MNVQSFAHPGVHMRRTVAINGRGLRVGEDHQNAKLTNDEVELVRELHRAGMSYKVLAAKFEVSKSLVAAICRWERRAEVATGWKTVVLPD